MEVLLKRSAKFLVASFPFVKHCKTTLFSAKSLIAFPYLSSAKKFILSVVVLSPAVSPSPTLSIQQLLYSYLSDLQTHAIKTDEFHPVY